MTDLSNLWYVLAGLLNVSLTTYYWVVIAAVIVSWVPLDASHPTARSILRFLRRATEPTFAFFRRILQLHRLKMPFDFTPILEDGWEAYKEAAELAALEIPVVLTPDAAGLRWKDPGGDIRLDNAAVLVAGGVKTALATGGVDVDPLLVGAMAVRHGLSEEAALRALTLTPAEILGVAVERGSIAVGKVADLVLLSGPPFQATTKVVQVIGSGTIVFPEKEGGR